MNARFNQVRREFHVKSSAMALTIPAGMTAITSHASDLADDRPREWTSDNPFLRGAFAPVFD